MSTIFLDELETNAVTAALIERRSRLAAAIVRLDGQPATEDRDFALACNRQALRHTELALIRIAGNLPDEAPPDPIDEAKRHADWLVNSWTESEMRAMAGDR